MDQSAEAFLAHYGIKGMRWGFRKQSDGSVKKTGRTAQSEDYLKSRDLLKNKPSTLSNNELKSLNERLQLEQTLSQLTAKQPGAVNAGRKFVSRAVDSAAKQTTSQLLSQGMKSAIALAIPALNLKK